MSDRLSLNQSTATTLPAVHYTKAKAAEVSNATATTDCVPLRELESCLISQWDSVRANAASYRSPFFGYAFLKTVAELEPHIEVAITRVGNQLVSALPFQRVSKQCARPVGLGINDAHGFLKQPSTTVNPLAVLRQCKLRSFEFHAAPPDLLETEKFAIGHTRSFLADLTVDPKGFEHYLRHSSDTIDRQGQKTRKLIRTLGPLRLDFDCRDARLIDLLVKLKCDQYQRTHTYNILAVQWIRKLLGQLHANVDSPIRGILSVLYAGDQAVALHYGMTEGDLLHYWFPVYDPKYSYGSPGTILFLEIAKQATELGYRAIDMGYGEQAYKHKLTNVITDMSYGIIDSSSLRRAIYRTHNKWQGSVKKLWLKDLVKPFIRKLLPNLGAERFGGN
jgi:CelD/BcsL family acetyltransferase involved in cellulose biosynthesis